MAKVLELFSQPVYLADDKYVMDDNEKESFKNVAALENLLNHTSKNKRWLEQENLKNLKKFILDSVKNFHHNVIGYDKRIELYITQSWLTMSKPEEGHHLHRHPNSIYSGVYYITGEHTETRFHSPNKDMQQVVFEKEKETCYLEEILTVKAEQGNLIIFPSQLSHDVLANPSKKVRTTLSFNTWFKGEVGMYDRLNNLKI